MRRSAALALILAAAFALFFLTATTRAIGLGGRTAAGFDLARAFADDQVIGGSSHPVGSAENARVRDFLIQRMTTLGLAPRVQRARSQAARIYGKTLVITQTPVENVIGVLPGRDRTTPALALMAHYDSVPGSPGAADDAAGVVSILEVVRALKAQGVPARDVMVVITDGEEAGLMGARAFFGQDPEAAHVGFVINLESRGGGGRPAMFQTGLRNGEAMRLFDRVERGASANSALAFAYKAMPNDTDFTIALKKGLPGFNFAFVGRQFDYHSPSSTPAVLDQGSLRLMGEQALALARPLAFDAALPKAAPDLVYTDFFGRMVGYSPVVGWGLLAIAAALALLAAFTRARRERPALSWLGSGALATAALIASPAALLFIARAAIGAEPGWLTYRPILARFPQFEAAMLAAALAGLLIAGLAFANRARPAPRWIGAIGVGVLAAAAVQLAAPTVAFILAWPLLAAAAIAALTGGGTRRSPVLWILAGLVAVIDLAWIGGFFHALLEALDAAPLGALTAWLAGLALWPWLAPAEGGRAGGVAAAVVTLAIAAGLVAWLRWTDPYDLRHPRAVMPIEVQAVDGSLWRASLAPADGWTRRWLGPGSVVDIRIAGAPGPLVGEEVARGPPPALPLAWSASADGSMSFTGTADSAGYLYLDIAAVKAFSAVSLDGLPLDAKGVDAILLRRMGPPAGLDLAVKPGAGGSPKVRWAFWRAGATPALPPGLMAWDKAGDTVVAAEPDLPPHK